MARLKSAKLLGSVRPGLEGEADLPHDLPGEGLGPGLAEVHVAWLLDLREAGGGEGVEVVDRDAMLFHHGARRLVVADRVVRDAAPGALGDGRGIAEDEPGPCFLEAQDDLVEVGGVLLETGPPKPSAGRLFVAVDLLKLLDTPVQQALDALVF